MIFSRAPVLNSHPAVSEHEEEGIFPAALPPFYQLFRFKILLLLHHDFSG
jgi:hypothetical protein